METKLVFNMKFVCGVTRIYPVCDQAKRLVKLIGLRTITPKQIEILKEMGFQIMWPLNDETN
ncbi:MAG: hypothetical protein KDA17_00640 [Candidatus Saccharibacteria bacterium]|nr:hypothetical protein [Candidatus Saccharibacteria bacterium]